MFCISFQLPAEGCEPALYAAENLQKYLRLAGEKAELTEKTGSGDCRVLLSLSESAPCKGAFRLAISQDSVLIEAAEGCGLVYGVFTFLERLGFRFLASDCDVIPDRIVLPPISDEIITPAFWGRELFWRESMDGDFAVRLKLNSARSSITPRQGGKMPFYNFSHTFNTLVPVEKYYDTHPEYFSMKDGKRLREKTQLCLSNPDVLQLCIEGVKTWAREHPDCRVFSVSMNDWYNACECPACRAIDEEEGSQAGSVIRFVNKVAEACAEEFPDLMIHTFAYLYCRKPPKITKPAKNVIVRLCTIECCFAHPIAECGRERGGIDVQYGSAANFSSSASAESAFIGDLQGWSKICENLFIWDYTVNYANYLLPFPNLNALAGNIRLFRQYGVSGVFEQGNFSLGRCSALGQLKTYLLAKLLWNPDEDVDRLIREFADGYYAGASEAMFDYIMLWKAQPEEHHIGIYDRADAPWLTDDLLAEAHTLLKKAESTARDSTVRERIRREALSVTYAMLVREAPETADHAQRVEAFAAEAKELGISELFERKELEASFELMKTNRYVADRSGVPAISYPI